LSNTTLAHAPAPTDEQIDRILDATADSFARQLRSPIMHAPSEQNLVYEEVTFPALDGVPLEGWFIPADRSDKLIIANHPMRFNRSGIPAHLEPWRSIWSSSGNAFEVNFIPDYKILPAPQDGRNTSAYPRSCFKSTTMCSRTPATCRRCSTTSRSPTRSSIGSATRPHAGMATSSSSDVQSRRSSGSRSTWPEGG